MGYYIGYAIAEKHYNNSLDKRKAVKNLIELDLQNQTEVENFVNDTGYFPKSIKKYRKQFEKNRPTIKKILQFENGSQKVSPKLTRITVKFSKKMDKRFRGFEFGPLGEENVLRVTEFIGFSKNGKSITFTVRLQPKKRYQLVLSDRFRTLDGLPLKPYLISIKTRSEKRVKTSLKLSLIQTRYAQ